MAYKFIEHKGHAIKYYDYIGRFLPVSKNYQDYINQQQKSQERFEKGNTYSGKEMFENQYENAKNTAIHTIPHTIFIQGLVALGAMGIVKGVLDEGMVKETIASIVATGLVETIFIGASAYNAKLFFNAKKELKTIDKIYKEAAIANNGNTGFDSMAFESNEEENTHSKRM